MWTRIPYSARIGLLVRLVCWRSCSETDSATTEKRGQKKREKTTRNATKFLISVDLGKVLATSTAHLSLEVCSGSPRRACTRDEDLGATIPKISMLRKDP